MCNTLLATLENETSDWLSDRSADNFDVFWRRLEEWIHESGVLVQSIRTCPTNPLAAPDQKTNLELLCDQYARQIIKKLYLKRLRSPFDAQDFAERFTAIGGLWKQVPAPASLDMCSAVQLAVEWLKGNRAAESTVLESLYREKPKRPKRDQVEEDLFHDYIIRLLRSPDRIAAFLIVNCVDPSPSGPGVLVKWLLYSHRRSDSKTLPARYRPTPNVEPPATRDAHDGGESANVVEMFPIDAPSPQDWMLFQEDLSRFIDRIGSQSKPRHRALGRLFLLEYLMKGPFEHWVLNQQNCACHLGFSKDELALSWCPSGSPTVQKILAQYLKERTRATDQWWSERLCTEVNTVQQWRGRYFYAPCGLRPRK